MIREKINSYLCFFLNLYPYYSSYDDTYWGVGDDISREDYTFHFTLVLLRLQEATY